MRKIYNTFSICMIEILKKNTMKRKIQKRMILLFTLPAVLIVFVTVQRVVSEYNKYREMNETVELANNNLLITGLVHEWQKERGLTSIRLADKQDAHYKKLMSQRRLSDKQYKALSPIISEAINSNDSASGNKQLWENLERSLKSVRKAVDDTALSGAQSIERYSKMNAKLIDELYLQVNRQTDKDMYKSGMANAFFVLGKENAGIERAVLGAVFASDTCTRAQRKHFNRLDMNQKMYFNLFMKSASSEIVKAYREARQSDAFTVTDNMRKKIYASDSGYNISADNWFEQQTKKINQLRTVEKRFNERIKAKAGDKRSAAAGNLWFNILGAVLVMALLFALLWGILGVLKSLRRLTGVTRRIAAGNLNENIDYQKEDEIGEIASALRFLQENFNILAGVIRHVSAGELNKADETSRQLAGKVQSSDKKTGQLLTAIENMLGKLSLIAKNIRKSSVGISGLSNTVKELSDDLAEAAGTQASSTEEISASMKQMASNTSQSVENSRRTKAIAEQAAQRIAGGKDSFDKVFDKMKRIAKKIRVIGQISDKTKILAINASIEAARAGEASKGFAVVADEVQKLAALTREAAEEIGESVESGLVISKDAVKELEETVPEIQKTARLTEEIYTGGNEQNSGIKMINDSVQSLTETTQEYTYSADKLADYAKRMNDDSETMKKQVDFFKLKPE